MNIKYCHIIKKIPRDRLSTLEPERKKEMCYEKRQKSNIWTWRKWANLRMREGVVQTEEAKDMFN